MPLVFKSYCEKHGGQKWGNMEIGEDKWLQIVASTKNMSKFKHAMEIKFSLQSGDLKARNIN